MTNHELSPELMRYLAVLDADDTFLNLTPANQRDNLQLPKHHRSETTLSIASLFCIADEVL